MGDFIEKMPMSRDQEESEKSNIQAEGTCKQNHLGIKSMMSLVNCPWFSEVGITEGALRRWLSSLLGDAV